MRRLLAGKMPGQEVVVEEVGSSPKISENGKKTDCLMRRLLAGKMPGQEVVVEEVGSCPKYLKTAKKRVISHTFWLINHRKHSFLQDIFPKIVLRNTSIVKLILYLKGLSSEN